MKLYYDETLNPRKACAVARHLNAPVEFVLVRLERGEHRRPEYLAINPNAKVPVLTDGGRNVWEANAIMCHLAVEAGSSMWPRDPRAQVEVVRWLSWDAAHFTRHGGTLYFERIIKPQFGIGAPDPAVVEEATGYFRKYAAVLDGHLRDREWLVDDDVTIADFAVAVALPYAEPAGLPLREFPEVARWHARLCALQGWREPFPKEVRAAA